MSAFTAAAFSKDSTGPTTDTPPAMASRFARKSGTPKSNNKAGLPSLKQLSDHLHTAPAAPNAPHLAASTALNEITTNVPAEACTTTTPSRLKLPQSAMARANLTSSTKTTNPGTSTTEVAEESGGRVPTDNNTASAPKKEGEDLDAKRLRLNRGLGVGLPGGASSPETPIKNTVAQEEAAVIPAIVVVSTSPGKADDTAVGTDHAAPSAAPHATQVSYPLGHEWTLFYDSKTYNPDPVTKKDDLLSEWEARLLTVGHIATVQAFAQYMNNIRMPSRLAKYANYHLFKKGIRPLWEDPANKDGGRWVVLVRNSPVLIDIIWANLTMALIGGLLDPEDQVCGIVVSTRPKLDRIQVWTRDRDNVGALNALGYRIIEAMALETREIDGVSVEFQCNEAHMSVPPNKFMRVSFAQRAVSATVTPNVDHTRLRPGRTPSSPMTHSMPLSLPGSPLAGSAPMRRNASGTASPVGATPFSGPMGGPRGGASGGW